MDFKNQTAPMHVGALLSQLNPQMIMRENFRIELPPEQLKLYLLRAVYAEVIKRGRKFINTEELDFITTHIAKCLTENSHYFGFILSGLCGNGKTTIVKALRELIKALQIRDEYGRWELRLLDAKTICRLSVNDDVWFNELCNERLLAIDDLGCEPLEIQSYGNIYTPIIDLLTRRYDRQKFTILTTNLTPQEIGERYGERIGDRLNEMMHQINFKEGSFRLTDTSIT